MGFDQNTNLPLWTAKHQYEIPEFYFKNNMKPKLKENDQLLTTKEKKKKSAIIHHYLVI